MKIMVPGSITSWQRDGKQWKTMTDFIFLGSKITADGDCSHEIKRHLLLGRIAMTNLHSTLKRRDITLPTKVHLVKAMIFPVIIYRCESWTIKKGGCWRLNAFELWCWRGLLRVPWTARRSTQSVLKKSTLTIYWKDWCWSSFSWSWRILWPPNGKRWLIGKVPDAGKDWRWKEKRAAEDGRVR